MKNYQILYILLAALFIGGCSEEDELQPSLKDVDRVSTQIDLNNTIVKRIYEDYNVGLLYEYSDTLDFTYAASTALAADAWGNIDIPQMVSRFADETTGELLPENEAAYKAYVDEALTFIDTALFKYFDANSFIATKMPAKVLLSENVFANSEVQGLTAQVSKENEARIGRTIKGSLRSVFNTHSIVFKVNQDDISVGTEDYIKDNFYVFLARMINTHKLYELVPDEFFGYKSDYYGKSIETVYREENGIEDDKIVWVIPKDWFFEKGFVDASYFIDNRYGLRTYKQYYDENYERMDSPIIHSKAIRGRSYSYEFVASKEVDVRSYVNELMFRNADELAAFPENIQDNLMIILDLFTSWGIDMEGINPELETFKANH